MSLKEIIYDWAGFNNTLFLLIHQNRPKLLEPLILDVQPLGQHENFPYYFLTVALLAVLSMLVRKIRGRTLDRNFVMSWVGLIVVMVIGYFCVAGTVGLLKEWLAMPRPYIVHAAQISLLGDKPDRDMASLPSGHATFVAFLLTVLWPKMFTLGRTICIIFLVFMMYCRVAIGVHFPADVVYGMLIGFFVTLTVRRIVYSLFRIPYY
jgi:signal peptidase II